jgi:hypothetical protein
MKNKILADFMRILNQKLLIKNTGMEWLKLAIFCF